MPHLLQGREFSSDQFNYDHVKGEFSQEASTLGLGVPVQFDPLYDDAIDVGIRIRSSRTGVVATYYLAHEHLWLGCQGLWTLLPVEDAPQKRNMSIMRTKVVIFND